MKEQNESTSEFLKKALRGSRRDRRFQQKLDRIQAKKEKKISQPELDEIRAMELPTIGKR